MSDTAIPAVRLPAILPDDRTPAQDNAVRLLSATPRGGIRGPFQAMLHSPEFLNRTQALGAFLRYESSLPQRLRELAILITARFWNQTYEWSMHVPIAAQAGVSEDLISAIGEQRTTAPVDADEAIVIRFCESLHVRHGVNDEDYQAAFSRFGNGGVVELTGICGYYALLAMVMNVARTAPPGSAIVPFSPPDMSAGAKRDHVAPRERGFVAV